MAKVINRLVALQRGAQPVERKYLYGDRNAAAQVWKLTDGGVILLQGEQRCRAKGYSPFVFERVERVEMPFDVVVELEMKRLADLRKKQGAES